MTATTSTDIIRVARRQRERVQRLLARYSLGDLLIAAREMANALLELRACDEVGNYSRVRGRVVVVNRGEIRIGEWALFESTVTPVSLRSHPGARLRIGGRCYFNFGVCIESRAEVTIGDRCHLGQYVHVMDNDQHDVVDHGTRPGSRPVVLEDDVWIGARTIVLKGVTIGRGTSIGAGSVVTRSLPPRCVAAGVPAKVIRYLDEP